MTDHITIFKIILIIAVSTLTACSDSSSEQTSSTSDVCSGQFTALDINQAQTGISISTDQSLCFSFDGIDATTYTLTLTTISGDSDFAVFSSPVFSESNIISYSVNNGLELDVISYTATSTSTYYIEVAAFLGGEFNLIITDTDNAVEVNTPPVAVLDTNIEGSIGQATVLDGSSSVDSDGDLLTYTWTLLSKPATSNLTFSPGNGETEIFNADVFGEYSFQLTVNDSLITSEPVITTVSVRHTFKPFNFRVTDAEYSDALESIIMVSADDSKLYIYNTVTETSSQVTLPLAPTSVSVSPDGLFAAIGHNGWVTYTSLSTNTIIKTLPVTTDVFDIVLDGNDYIHAFPRADQWEKIRSINITSEVETLNLGNQIYAGTRARLHPDGMHIYGADNGLSPSDIEKYDISGSPVNYLYDSPYHGNYSMCGNLWFSEDGQRIFTSCGNVFRSSNDPAQDMSYNGALENVSGTIRIVTLDQSNDTEKIVMVTKDIFTWSQDIDTKLHFYNYKFLTIAETIDLPRFSAVAKSYLSHAEFIFFNSDGTKYFSIVRADGSSGLLLDYALFTHQY